MKLLLLVVLAGVWTVRTTDEVRRAQDEWQIWRQATRLSPEKPRVWVNLGTQFALRGAPNLGDEAYQTALELAVVRPAVERSTTVRIVSVNRERLSFDLTTWLNDTP